MDYQTTLGINEDYDIIVVGGGPAGCTAAAAAAREGSKTLLIEQSAMLGGMGTAGLVPAWCPYSDKEKVIYKGLAERILNSSKAATAHVPAEQLDWVPIDPEALKMIYDNLMAEFGVDILFNTTLIDALTDADGNVEQIVVANKKGLAAYYADVFIDCSGDADLAVKAKADYEIGDEDNEAMPATLCFTISNVDLYAYEHHPVYGRLNGGMHPHNPDSFIHRIPQNEDYPNIKDTHFCNNIVGPGTIGFNAGHIFNVDATDPLSVSKAMVQGRKIARELHHALKQYFPEAFAGSFLVLTAPALGVRESRRIVGDYQLSVEDYLSRSDFEDEVCRNSYYLDIHYTEKELLLLAKGEINESNRTARYGAGESHGVPYRCLIPKSLSNLLVAGRSISSDRRINGSVRVMPVCLAMGEAAGLAASMALAAQNDVRAIDVRVLREKLKQYGAYIH